MARKRPSRHSAEQFALFQARLRDTLAGDEAIRFDELVTRILRKDGLAIASPPYSAGSTVSAMAPAPSLPDDQSAAVLASALDQVAYGIVLLDKDLKARFVNQSCYHILGLVPPPAG